MKYSSNYFLEVRNTAVSHGDLRHTGRGTMATWVGRHPSLVPFRAGHVLGAIRPADGYSPQRPLLISFCWYNLPVRFGKASGDTGCKKAVNIDDISILCEH